jgi:hypothetical protein
MNIGFIINFSKNDWIGGYNYYLHLISSLKKFEKNNVNPIIIVDKKERILQNKELNNFEYRVCAYFSNSNSYLRIFNKLLIIIFGKSFLYEKFFAKNKIDIISHSHFAGRNSSVKSYPWFPDFQEYFYPKFFSKYKIILRKLNLFLAIIHSKKIIVSSRSAMKDLKKISLRAFKKSEILIHTNRLIKPSEIYSSNYIKKKYNIKKNFFLLPNHYWMHKNHLVVLKALKVIRNKNFQIISTGTTSDHRNKKHFNYILKYIEDNNIGEFYKILGLIPERDFNSLIKCSLGVINPSKFEGWGNSGDKAIIFGKPAILSNIGPHRELSGKIFFFSPNDHYKLAKILFYLSRKIFFNKNYSFEYKKNQLKTKKFIKNYLRIIKKS